LLARRLLPFSIALFLVCIVGAAIGFKTCDTESGPCPAWQEWLNAIALYGIGVFLVSTLVLIVIAPSRFRLIGGTRSSLIRTGARALACASVRE
jgi:hypothetical protein